MAVRSLSLKLAKRENTRTHPLSAIGKVVALSKNGRVRVELDDGLESVSARFAQNLSPAELRAAVAQKRDALLVFTTEARQQAVVIALLAPEDELAAPPSPVGLDGRAALEAVVDGRRVSIVGQEEISLRCGQASITLRRNGRVVVRGTHVETDSEGLNRIKGATVKIN